MAIAEHTVNMPERDKNKGSVVISGDAATVPGGREPLLEFRSVSRTFPISSGLLHRNGGVVHAVTDLSMIVNRGETLGLVGESGCGKSTLARMAVGLLSPTSGEILFRGEPVFGGGKGKSEQYSSNQLKKKKTIGRLQMIFQDPFSSLNPRLSVGHSVAEPLQGLPYAERQQRVKAILECVGLRPEHASRFPHEFSGGQRQRIAIARALISRPDLVVCDEAVSALDASVQAQVLNLLKDVQEEFGLAYLFISHNLSVVGFMSDRVAVMYLGRIVELADHDQLFVNPLHPYTRALFSSAPVPDPAARNGHRFLAGEMPSPVSPPSGCAFHPRCIRAIPQCRESLPELREVEVGHWVRCHGVEGDSSFAKM